MFQVHMGGARGRKGHAGAGALLRAYAILRHRGLPGRGGVQALREAPLGDSRSHMYTTYVSLLEVIKVWQQ